MSFQWPLALLALLLVPAVVAGYVVLERRRTRYAVRYTNLEVLAAVASETSGWRRFVPAALALAALTLATGALARPKVPVSVQREQATIALTLDTSGSMRADDVKPTRIQAAQEAIRRFLDKVPDKYRVGLVTFSGEAFVAAPPSYDRQAVVDALQYVYPGMGTAIGDALARAVEVLHPVTADDTPASTPAAPRDPDAPLSAILLLSDGAQTRGTLQPLEGAARAKSFGIPVYTIALGTPEGVVIGRGGMQRPVPPDPVTLAAIAKTTGGEFFATKSDARLNAVYEDLASRLGSRTEQREATFALLGAAAVLLLAGLAASVLWVHRLP
jgi:Ca-activated chloride channel family protein